MSKSDALKKKTSKYSHECKNCGIKIHDERECKSSKGEEETILGEEKSVRRNTQE